jgi:dienelactone hydrolase
MAFASLMDTGRKGLRSPEDKARLLGNYVHVEVHIYPADHGFYCEQRDGYDAPSAKLAWTRTLEFLRKHLG